MDLESIYAYPDACSEGRSWLRANMVTSVDGAATADGLSGGLSGEPDRRVFSVLRGLADVVVVGATTVRREGYGPVKLSSRHTERRLAAGRPPTPVIAVVSRSLDLDLSSELFTAGTTRTIVITAAAAPATAVSAVRSAADVIIAGEERVDLARALDELAGRGYTRMLTEGGPHLLAQMIAAGRLDELCLTVSPLLTGDDPALRILAGTRLDPPAGLRLGHLLEEDGFLFARYLINRTDDPASLLPGSPASPASL